MNTGFRGDDDFKPECRRNKLAAVPKTCCRFNVDKVGKGCRQQKQPTPVTLFTIGSSSLSFDILGISLNQLM